MLTQEIKSLDFRQPGLLAGPSFEQTLTLGYLPIVETSQKYFVESVKTLTETAENVKGFPPSVVGILRTITNQLIVGLDYPPPPKQAPQVKCDLPEKPLDLRGQNGHIGEHEPA